MNIEGLQGLTFNDFKLINIIGKGSFGIVYKAEYLRNQKHYAIKIEQNKTLNPQLHFENDIFNYIRLFYKAKNQTVSQFPKIYAFFSTRDHTFLVMQLLGKSLYQIFKESMRKFDQKQALEYGHLALNTLIKLHKANIIHRDIKPQNFIFRNPKQLCLIDFGLSKKVAAQGQRSKNLYIHTLIGTSRYASINSHEGKPMTKKDDMQSFFYVLIYLLKGSLPWQNLKSSDNKNEKILKMKKSISQEQLCQNLPKGILLLARYLKSQLSSTGLNYDYIAECIQNSLIELKTQKSEQIYVDSVKNKFQLQFKIKVSKFTGQNVLAQTKIQDLKADSHVDNQQKTKKKVILPKRNFADHSDSYTSSEQQYQPCQENCKFLMP